MFCSALQAPLKEKAKGLIKEWEEFCSQSIPARDKSLRVVKDGKAGT